MKLVHDKIPEMFKELGIDFTLKIVTGEEKLKFLIDKLKEKVKEFEESRNLEELADILEVVECIVKEMNYTLDYVLELKKLKRSIKGGF